MAVGRVRPAVSALAAYRPGKAAAQAEQDHDITNAIKLASNENPYSPVPSVVAAIAEAAAGVNRYSDHRALELRARLGDWLEVDSTQIAVGCGSVGVLQQLCLTYINPGDEIVYPWPSFEAYPVLVKTMGGIPITPALVDHAFDMDAIATAVNTKTTMVLLASPNNPTGTAVHTDEIRKLLQRIPDDVIVVVDEAYREFAGNNLGDPIKDLLAQHRNVVVLRTFSKAYGLAGLRTGYAVADPEIIQDIDKVLLPFTVNALAQVGALAALDALDDVQERIDLVIAERERVVNALHAAGWKMPETRANFVYLPIGGRTEEVGLELEHRGIVIRPFPGDGIRITIGTPAENDRVLSNLGEIIHPTS
jgi:histidinol-phosphate aminotransferase